MAQLNSRGTMIRSRWDFFERSDGFAHVHGTGTGPLFGAYFANNSSGATNLDIFNLTWSASVTGIVEVAFFVPPIIVVPLAPTESFIHPLLPDSAQPPGVLGMFTNFTSVYWTIVRYSNGANQDEMTPIPGSYFCTLPPSWAIAVWTPAPSSPAEFSMTVWYQEMLDNISPAV